MKIKTSMFCLVTCAVLLLVGCQKNTTVTTSSADAKGATVSEFSGTIKNSIRDSKPEFLVEPKAKPDAPNILIILADDLGYSDVGTYGSEIQTPHIDQLAQNGLRYSNLTVTAICSATRASLLTGLNHHSTGIGWLGEVDFGYPGYRGELAPNVVTLPQILQQHGYATLAAGKWHLTNGEHRSRAGPFSSWPTQKGFDRYWGFLDGETDQFEPAFLVSGNEFIEVSKRPDYYFPDDLTRHAIQMVRDLRAVDQKKPFFLYYAPGAVHAPHGTKEVDRRKYLGKYSQGWDEVRAQRLAREKALGIVPLNTDLTARNPQVEAWVSLTPDQRKMYARFQENFAGFVDNLDQQVGTLLEYIRSTGELDNTIVIFMSDNGASEEGDVEGQANGLAFYHSHKTTTAENLKHFDDLGGPDTQAHYPIGWAQVGNTPFKRAKRTAHGGGVRVPFIVSWPKGITARGEVRTQFHHVNDVVPTILEALGIQAPTEYHGVTPKPIEGISFAYTFSDAKTPTHKKEQYYEIEGNRAFYEDDWRLVTYREPDQRFGDAPWELYNLKDDFSEAHDLAAKFPEKVKALEAKWWQAAAKYQVLPMIDAGLLERPRYTKFTLVPQAKHREFFVGSSTIPHNLAPLLPGQSYTISANLQRDKVEQGGVIVAQGDKFSGYTLFVKDNHLVYERNIGSNVIHIETQQSLPSGSISVQFKFDKPSTGVAVIKGLLSEGTNFNKLAVLKGKGSLWVDGKKLAEADIPTPFFVAWEGLDIGRDTGSAVSPSYAAESPFIFSGRLDKVVYDIQ